MIEFLFEFLLQVVLEIFGDVVIHAVAEERRIRNVALAFLGYAAAGVCVGFATVYFFPSHFIDRPDLRTVNLAVTPVAIAAAMAWYGAVRRKREKDVVGFEKFIFAYVFALAVAAVRYVAAG